MTTGNTERVGLSDPLILEGKDAVLARRIIASNVGYLSVTNDPFAHRSLERAAFPPLERCEGTRDIIFKAAGVIGAVEFQPEVTTPEYDAFCTRMSKVMTDAQDAFANRPEGCEMTEEQDNFQCRRCYGFDVSTSPLS